MMPMIHSIHEAHSAEELPHTITVTEAATLCSMTRSGVHVWLNAGKLRGRWTGTIWLIETADLLKFTKKHGIVLTFANRPRPMQA